MRQLFPAAGEVDPLEAYGRLARVGGRPSVRLNMIATVDGAASLQGRSGALGGPADKGLFALLRSLADVIVVGAATMRAEGYGPARLDDAARKWRSRAGLSPVPAIAVVTRSCRLDWASPFFTQAEQRPIVLTASAGSAEHTQAEQVADVIVAGETDVDLAAAVEVLGRRGHDNVLAEGGPGVAAQLATAGLLDEMCITVSPVLVGGDAHRILHGPAVVPPQPLELVHVLEADRYLFLRYCRGRQ